MASKGKIESNNRKIALVEKYRDARNELRKKSKDMKLPASEREEARRKLAALPRNSSETRVRNRCEITGRPRGYLKKFKLCRIKFRELALKGQIPGVTKSSW